ncbi:MAG: dienelactone hydrolase family protein [Rhodobacterales bacterium]|nr:dienelactone hydrolase family protein [Rhodobacterales bacterium]
MGETITIAAQDGHELAAYRAVPANVETNGARGGVVVVQEIFGVNIHIRDVCDRLAAAGFVALAPALFDRLERGVELDYDQAGIARGRGLVEDLGFDNAIRDVWAAAKVVHPEGRAGVVGFCWGGSVAWLANCRLCLTAASCFYGRHIVNFLHETPRRPAILHFGDKDPSIPLSDVDKIRSAFPELPVHLYPGAGHGFNCDRRADFHPDSAELAWGRTLDLFREVMHWNHPENPVT